MMSLPITTIGDGAMATVCSCILANKGAAVTMWVREPDHLQEMLVKRENVRYLPGFPLPTGMKLTGDAAEALNGCELLVCAVPTQFIRGTLGRLAPHVPAGIPVVSVAKGIENDTMMRPTEIVLQLLGSRPIAALSGPNIAGELARQLPATAVAASSDDTLARRVQELFTTASFRVYRNNDLLGVELAGAMKNVIAVAAGILDGLKAGNNAKAALLTRGLVEISRLGIAMGAQAETFSGLAGLGDLVTTCVSPEGRNRSFGERVGKGEKVEDVLKSMPGVVEGVPTTRSVLTLAQRYHVEMPISQGLYAVLFERKDPIAGIADLMRRQLKDESI